MNAEIVIWNECINDNSRIHLYWNGRIGLWCAFGVSAFWGALWLKTNDMKDNSHYSEEMCMPVTLLALDQVMTLAQTAADIEEMTTTYVCLRMVEKIDNQNYSAWANRLRG